MQLPLNERGLELCPEKGNRPRAKCLAKGQVRRHRRRPCTTSPSSAPIPKPSTPPSPAAGQSPSPITLVALDAKKREATTKVQAAQSRRNEASKAIGQAMGQGDKEKAEALKAEVAEIKASMPEWEEAAAKAGAELDDMLARLPNLPAEDVPQGADEEDNIEQHQWGTKREFDFEPKEHADIGPALGMDFETGTKLSGARFTFLRGDIARLHRALAQFMLDTADARERLYRVQPAGAGRRRCHVRHRQAAQVCPR